MNEGVAALILLLAILTLVALVPPFLRWLIRLRLGGYIRRIDSSDPVLPERTQAAKRVCVVGAGVAGMTAALVLARRGYAVTLVEKNAHLGGKLGSFQVPGADGTPVWVSHGFHAFFRHYYNLNRILDSLNIRGDFQSIGDYVILGRDGSTLRFGDVASTPVLNIISLMTKGVFPAKDALRAPGRDMYGVFLEFDPEETFSRFDHLSYAEFSRIAQVPPRLKLAFNTFARAFFASEDRLSFAELVKSFHFYYLSHDGGLVYDYPVVDYDEGILSPWKEEMFRLGVRIVLGQELQELSKEDSGFLLNGERFEKVVVATDVVGARSILGHASGIPKSVNAKFDRLMPGQRYAVYRIVLDKDVREDIPMFVITEKSSTLDSVTTYHRFEKQAQEQVRTTKGAVAVLELHCYSVPDELPDEQIRSSFMAELHHFFPELAGAKLLWEHLQLKRDFTAFHVNQHEHRPTTDTGVSGLYCAGDWVKLPFSAMLLEGACASGIHAANAILAEDGLRSEPLYAVPHRGVLAGMPTPPARQRLYRAS